MIKTHQCLTLSLLYAVMKSFNLKYHKSSVLLKTLLAIFASSAVAMLIILLNLPNTLSVGLIVPFITISLLIIFGVFKWITGTYIFVPCTTAISEKGISFKIEKASFLYHQKEFSSGWDNITHISEKFDNNNAEYFYQVTFKNPYFKANFSARENGFDEAEKFFAELRFYKETHMHSLTTDLKSYHIKNYNNLTSLDLIP